MYNIKYIKRNTTTENEGKESRAAIIREKKTKYLSLTSLATT
jgi:hypothetical protein